MSTSPEDFIEKLKQSKANYINNLPTKISEIKLIWNQLNNNEWRQAVMLKMQNLSHNLAGSGGTFGIPELSKVAKNLELALGELKQYGDKTPPEAELNKIDDLLISLQEVELETIKESDAPTSILSKDDTIYILDDNAEEALGMSRQLMYYGCNVKIIKDAGAMDKFLKNATPLTILIDADFAEKSYGKYNVIQTLRKEWLITCPIIFMSTRDDFNSRIQASKSNASAYFTKPLDISLLVERINILTNAALLEPYRILIVEDDEELANYYALTLQKNGIKAYIETKPEHALDTITQVNPELLVIDLYMPNYNGIDLLNVIRQHQSLLTLPVILLTSEKDIDLQFFAREAGVDDFLSKPIEPDHLVDAVLNRVQRSRYMNASMSKDSLTGLYVHKKINEYLNIQINICDRYSRTVTYAIIDIDDFKHINDTYGHLIGDNVLISLANLLKTKLRATDFIGRYGGEEFVIIFSETSEEEALQSLDRIRNEFSDMSHFAGTTSFRVTFSGGIASYPKYGDVDALMATADEALYTSKRSGKNRITVA